MGPGLRLARQPRQVAQREAELVGAEPLRGVRELIEDRLVQLRHRGQESGRGERRPAVGRLGLGCLDGSATATAVGSGRVSTSGLSIGSGSGVDGGSGVSDRGGLRRHDRLQLVRLTGDRGGRRFQLRIPPDELGQLGREEDQHGVRCQVRHLRELDVGVEGRLAHRRADPPSRIE